MITASLEVVVMGLLSFPHSSSLGSVAQQDMKRLNDLINDSTPDNTKRAYRADLKDFISWCDQRKVRSLPADHQTVALYVSSLVGAGKKPATIKRRLAAIGKAHELSGTMNPCAHPVVKAAVRGYVMKVGARPTQKSPITQTEIKKIIAACEGETLFELRNRALLLVGFAGAFRRSELVALDVTDLEWSDEGVALVTRRGKSDQTGQGHVRAIPFVGGPTCAAVALAEWINAAEIENGPVFRTLTRGGSVTPRRLDTGSVALIVKSMVKGAGMDPAKYAAHSLRAGHVTEARRQGIADSDTMATTGHKRVETLDIYDRRNNPFQRGSAGAVLSGSPNAKTKHVR
jgi:site-specific recombinase XerD